MHLAWCGARWSAVRSVGSTAARCPVPSCVACRVPLPGPSGLARLSVGSQTNESACVWSGEYGRLTPQPAHSTCSRPAPRADEAHAALLRSPSASDHASSASQSPTILGLDARLGTSCDRPPWDTNVASTPWACSRSSCRTASNRSQDRCITSRAPRRARPSTRGRGGAQRATGPRRRPTPSGARPEWSQRPSRRSRCRSAARCAAAMRPYSSIEMKYGWVHSPYR